jgi:hypothetical protein
MEWSWAISPSSSGGSPCSSNYRTEALTFEVVDFSEPYHVILGRLCFVKFMTIPIYTYLKLKITGPAGIITMEANA